MLGALIRAMETGGFNSPGFVAQYSDMSVHQVLNKIWGFKGIEWCDSVESQSLHKCVDLVNTNKLVIWVNCSALGLGFSNFLELVRLGEPEEPVDSEGVAQELHMAQQLERCTG
jgi:hypothetical protein